MEMNSRQESPVPNPATRRIDEHTLRRLQASVGRTPEQIAERLKNLDREWDFDRTALVQGGLLGLAGVALAAKVSRTWLLLPAYVFGFLALHGIAGWCPSVPLWRAMGQRTRREIEAERCALKQLRGDFRASSSSGADPVQKAISAVRA